MCLNMFIIHFIFEYMLASSRPISDDYVSMCRDAVTQL